MTACRWQPFACFRVSLLHDEAKQKTNQHCLRPQRADQECNNASLCYFFTLLEVGIWLCSVAQPPPRTLVHIYQRSSGDQALNNFAASACAHLLRPPGLKPEFLTLRTGGSQHADFMMRARFHVLLWKMCRLKGMWCNPTITMVSWPECKLVIIFSPQTIKTTIQSGLQT